jgi:hypothetical protein
MKQKTFINFWGNYFLLFTFLILIVGCSSPKVIVTKKYSVNNVNNLSIYKD